MNIAPQHSLGRHEISQFTAWPIHPSRILIIPDGHRRYAQRTGLPYQAAYRLGAEVAARVACAVASRCLVPHLTFFPLARKNFEERDEATLSVIFSAIDTFIDMIDHFSPALKLSLRGRLTRLPASLADRLCSLSNRQSPDDTGNMELELLIDYDGHEELAAMSPEEVNAALNRPFDIVVRTGGAFRLSGAPIIECSSADMFSLPMAFPEFTYRDLYGVVRAFIADKKRRLLLRSNPVYPCMKG